MTINEMYIDVQESDLEGGGVPSEIYWVVTIELFKKLVEGVSVMGSKDKNVICKLQSEVRHI